MESRQLSISEIRELLPHRYPMLLVDRVHTLVPGISAVGIKCVTYNEPFFVGHFPHEPVMPGVLIVEAMAQTAGLIALSAIPVQMPQATVYLAAVESTRFRKPVVPGNVLEMHVRQLRNRSNVWQFEGQGFVDGVLHAEARFTAMIKGA